MQPLFLSMQAIAAKRDEGLRPELIGLLHHAKAYRCCGTDIDEHVSTLRCAPEPAPATSLNLLDVEVAGPRPLLPCGHKCRLHFGEDLF